MPGQANSFPFVLHTSGLRLLNNLEGSGNIGQITPADARTVLEPLLTGGGYTLVELSLHPIELMSETALRCALVVLVTASNPPAVAAARSALNVMERIGLSRQHTVVVLLGADNVPDRLDLERAVLVTLPPDAEPSHPAFRILADHLLGLIKTSGQ